MSNAYIFAQEHGILEYPIFEVRNIGISKLSGRNIGISD
jgi:hypothetical protein